METYKKDILRAEIIGEISGMNEELKAMISYRKFFWDFDEIRNKMNVEIDKQINKIKQKEIQWKSMRKKYYVDNRGIRHLEHY